MFTIFKKRAKEVWGREITVKFASVQEYFDDVKSLDLKFPTYRGDFIPYV
jgi:hypothetical protein